VEANLSDLFHVQRQELPMLVIEHKTTSEDIGAGSFYWQRLTIDSQASLYFDGMKAKGFDVHGVLYDLLRKPGLEPLKATKEIKIRKDGAPYANQRIADETPDEYRDRILAAIAEDPNRYFQRGVVVRLESESEDAAWDRWQTAESIRLARHSSRWPRNAGACWEYGRPCDYWAICSGQTTADDREQFEARETKTHLPIQLSQSGMKTFRACPRRYKFAYEVGIRSRKSSESLKTGRSIHSALEQWWKTNGDLDAARAVLDRKDLFRHAKEDAMLCAYHARWSADAYDIIGVEQEFVIPLVNPETGSKSRTFELMGRIDALASVKDVERKSA
jgi:hypothetical protein